MSVPQHILMARTKVTLAEAARDGINQFLGNNRKGNGEEAYCTIDGQGDNVNTVQVVMDVGGHLAVFEFTVRELRGQ